MGFYYIRKKTETSEAVLFHTGCGIKHVRMGNNRTLFCPTCKETEIARLVTHILCCSECDKPLAVTSDLSCYCVNCNYHPSMQDTYFIPITNTQDWG